MNRERNKTGNMARNKHLNKEKLKKYYGIDLVTQDEQGEWHVWTWVYPVGTTRTNPLTGRRQEKEYVELDIIDFTQHYKHVPDKTYKIVVGYSKYFGYQWKYISLSRVLYAYFIDEIPEGKQVDHIDNNPLNNSLDNLQLLTPSENMLKRTKDNPGVRVNGSKPKKAAK